MRMLAGHCPSASALAAVKKCFRECLVNTYICSTAVNSSLHVLLCSIDHVFVEYVVIRLRNTLLLTFEVKSGVRKRGNFEAAAAAAAAAAIDEI